MPKDIGYAWRQAAPSARAIRMSFPPRIRASFRAATIVALALGGASLLSGCELLGLERQSEPIARSTQATDPPSPPPVAALPGKQATRRGSYVFYHDFDLNPNDPIFASLETLPDQVYGELKLPPTNTIIQVFLFETQER